MTFLRDPGRSCLQAAVPLGGEGKTIKIKQREAAAAASLCFVVLLPGRAYLAYSVARLSRMTLILIWPG